MPRYYIDLTLDADGDNDPASTTASEDDSSRETASKCPRATGAGSSGHAPPAARSCTGDPAGTGDGRPRSPDDMTIAVGDVVRYYFPPFQVCREHLRRGTVTGMVTGTDQKIMQLEVDGLLLPADDHQFQRTTGGPDPRDIGSFRELADYRAAARPHRPRRRRPRRRLTQRVAEAFDAECAALEAAEGGRYSTMVCKRRRT